MAASKQINLLPKIEVNEEKVALTLRLRVVSIIVVALALVAEGVLLTYSLSIVDRSRNVREQITRLEETIASYKEVESQALVLKQKVRAISSIIKAEFSYPKLLSDLASLMTQDMYFTELSAESSGKVTLTGVAKSSTDLGTFIANITDPQKGGVYFSEATLGSLSGAKDGSYRFTLTLTYKKPVPSNL